MNKYLILLLFPILVSCEKLFHEDENEYLFPETYQAKIDIINGIYANLVRVHNDSYPILLRRSEDFNYYYQYSWTNCWLSQKVNFSNAPGYIYQKLFTTIINVNKLQQYINKESNPELLGEIYFLRAYSYFKLARLFGVPPIITDVEVNYQVGKPDYREVYEFIIADLTEAINFLPDTYVDARIPNETPHKGTAKALLAEVYLAMAGFPVNDNSKYQLAASTAAEVIENADYYGFNLLPDFADLWKFENRNNRENIFGLFYRSSGSFGRYRNTSSSEEVTLFIGGKRLVFNNPGSVIEMEVNVGCQPEMKYFDSFPHNYRKIMSMTTGRYFEAEIELFDTTISFIEFSKYDPINSPCLYNPLPLKNLYLPRIQRMNTEYTLYLLRFAQTLLTYAEAKGHLGQIDESAYEAVNMIRRRANKADIHSTSVFDLEENLTAEQFTDSVICERKWELYFEPDGRWFDIVRLDLKSELPGNRYSMDMINTVEPEYLNSNWYFFLIPMEDRWLNPNLE